MIERAGDVFGDTEAVLSEERAEAVRCIVGSGKVDAIIAVNDRMVSLGIRALREVEGVNRALFKRSVDNRT